MHQMIHRQGVFSEMRVFKGKGDITVSAHFSQNSSFTAGMHRVGRDISRLNL